MERRSGPQSCRLCLLSKAVLPSLSDCKTVNFDPTWSNNPSYDFGCFTSDPCRHGPDYCEFQFQKNLRLSVGSPFGRRERCVTGMNRSSETRTRKD